MEYRVIKKFRDLQDDEHVYNVGDGFPRDGYSPSGKRISSLLSGANKLGVPVIEEAEQEKAKKARKKKDEAEEETE